MQMIPGTLGVLLTDGSTGLPLARVPVFAELAATEPVHLDLGSPQASDSVLASTSKSVQGHAAQVATDQVGAERVARILATIVASLAASGIDFDPGKMTDLFDEAVRDAIANSPGRQLSALDDNDLTLALWTALASSAAQRGIRIPDPPEPTHQSWTCPLGMLATDHAGYCSFDLLQLPELERSLLSAAISFLRSPTTDVAVVSRPSRLAVAMNVYPMSLRGTVVDALSHPRLAADAILAKIEIAFPVASAEVLSTLGLTSIQRPSLADWRLSPSSFAASQASLLATDGCEDLMPSNLAVKEFFAYQSVAITDLRPADLKDHSADITLGVVQAYRMAWYSLGHSLGEILHSTALAPGESVNLAVIDWSRSEPRSTA